MADKQFCYKVEYIVCNPHQGWHLHEQKVVAGDVDLDDHENLRATFIDHCDYPGEVAYIGIYRVELLAEHSAMLSLVRDAVLSLYSDDEYLYESIRDWLDDIEEKLEDV